VEISGWAYATATVVLLGLFALVTLNRRPALLPRRGRTALVFELSAYGLAAFATICLGLSVWLQPLMAL
jgi:hypothetical protein